MPAPSLQELSLVQSGWYLLAALGTMGDSFTPSGERDQVEKLRSYLILCLGSAVNDVCAKAHELLPKTIDARSLFAMEMQKFRQTFVFQNEHMFNHICTDVAFWGSQLGKLTNVTVLDIRTLQCSDGILDAVSSNCHQLEVFRFDSQFRCYLAKLPKCLITTDGITSLLKLKNLRFVHDESNFGRFPRAFMQTFFRTILPQLENFSHEILEDLVLNSLGDLTYLPLTDLTIYKVTPQYVLRMLKLCPNLSRLCLFDLYGGIFDDLTESSVTISSFRIEHFSADYLAGLCHFLLNKGDTLTSLEFQTDALFSVNEVMLIGECCPNLQHLGMDLNVRRSEYPYASHDVKMDTPIFGSLTSLCIRSRAYTAMDVRIIDLFIKNDRVISSVVLEGKWTDWYFRSRNPFIPGGDSIIFPNATRFEVWIDEFEPYSAEIGLKVIQSMYNSPKLKFIHVYWYSGSLDQFKINTLFVESCLPTSQNIRYMSTYLKKGKRPRPSKEYY